MRRQVRRLGLGMRADGPGESWHHPFHPPWFVGKLRGRLIQPLLLSPFYRYAGSVDGNFPLRPQTIRATANAMLGALGLPGTYGLGPWGIPTPDRAVSLWRGAGRAYPAPLTGS